MPTREINTWKVLLIDDDQDEYVLARGMLAAARRDRYQLDWEPDSRKAKRRILHGSYDAILIDYLLGEENGINLIREVRARGCKAPIILVTGYGDEDIDMEAMQAGATEFLDRNDLSIPLLERTLRYVIRNHHLAEHARIENEERQAQLEAERARLNAVIDNAPAGIVMTDAEGRFTVVNRAAQALFPSSGISGDAWGPVSRYTLRRIDGQLFPSQELPLVLSLQGKTIIDQEMVVRHEDGKEVLILANAAPIFEPNGKIIGAVAVMNDMTDYQKTKQALEASQERERARAAELQAIMDAVPAALWIARDSGGQYIFANRFGYDILRMRPGENASKSAPENAPQHFHPVKDGQEIPPENLPVQIAAGGTPVSDYEFDLVFDDGAVCHLLGNATPILDQDGKPAGAVSAFIDITERKNIEQALHESEDRFHKVLANTPTFMFTTDCDLRYTWVYNPRHGFRAEDMLGKRDDEIMSPDEAEVLMAPKREVLRTEKPARCELVFKIRGEMVAYHAAFDPIFSREGEVIGISAVAMDITEFMQLRNRQIEDQARIEIQRHIIEQREQERLQIARDLHDGPLQDLIGINFRLNELLGEFKAFPEAKAVVQGTKEDLQYAIGDLRDFASELRPPMLANFGLEKAIRAHLDEFSLKHPELKIEFEAQQQGEVLPETVRTAMYRIYQEMLNNVIKHAQASEVTIRFYKNLDQAELVVQDNGRGFDLPKDWVELARRKHLGLVGIQERTEAIGGKLEVTTKPGQGTTMRVIAPLWKE